MSGPSRRDIRRMLERLENEDGDDVPDIIIIKDTVVETPWSDTDADDREVPPDSVTRLKWDGGSWEGVET